MRTRAFLQKLLLSQKLPVFALVDGDAYGIEIMCTYRYGSLAMAYESLHMNVPDIKWLGIQADDIVAFRLQGSRFTDRELRRFATLKKRPYLQGDHPWLEQIVLMEKLGITDKAAVISSGDTEANVRSAEDTGVTTVGVLTGHLTRELFESLGADYVLNSSANLLDIVGK